MKKIKIHFLGFWKEFDPRNNMFTNILHRRYELEFDSVDPDFLVCSPLCKPFEYMRYDCPRIMYTGEFISVDFTAIDYFIGYDDITFGDRAMRFPLFLFNDDAVYTNREPLTEDEAVQILRKKEYFCNYIFGHNTELGIREQILDGLQAYKRVECAGTHRNNMPGGKTFNIQTKFPFMEKCKFSIAAESVCYPGFTSEKIGHAFSTYSIPVYFGDPDICKDFNKDAFIDYSVYGSVENVVNKVIELDKNDDAYIHMLCQSRYNAVNYEELMFKKLENFLFNIFDQDKEEAYRRPRFYRAERHEFYLKDYSHSLESITYRMMRRLKLIPVIEPPEK